MKKFAAGILTALCATAIATAQPIDQPTDYAQQPVSTQAAPAQTAAPQAVATEPQANEAMPIDEQQQTYSVQKKPPSVLAHESPSFTVISGDSKTFPTVLKNLPALAVNSALPPVSTS